MSRPTEAVQGPAIVTGGGQGLGRTFSRALAAEGVPVVVADLDETNALRVADEIGRDGGEALGVRADVSDPDSVEAMVAATVDAFGSLAVVVNNAALFSTLQMGPFTEIPLPVWDQVMQVNVTGAFLVCRAAVPVMEQRGYGKIVNVSSATVWMGRPGYLHYVTSKAALIGFTRALAAEVGPMGVRVNAMTPGSTRTEIERETITAEARQQMADQTALRRVQVPEDLVGTLVFLASTSSDFMTGQTVNVDGGYAFH